MFQIIRLMIASRRNSRIFVRNIRGTKLSWRLRPIHHPERTIRLRRRHVDVTNRLKELARQDRAFRMGNSTFGIDPDPGQEKILRIYARGRTGRNACLTIAKAVLSTAHSSAAGAGVNGEMAPGMGDGKVVATAEAMTVTPASTLF